LSQICDLYFIDGNISSTTDDISISAKFCLQNKEFPNLIDFNHFLVFFKMKNEKVEADPLFQKKQQQELQIKKIISSFKEFNNTHEKIYDIVPLHLIKNLAEIEYKLYQNIFDEMKQETCFDLFVKFYINNKLNFDIINKINQDFSFGKTGFLFAENFRFKSKKDTLNLFNLKKELRNIVVPQNEKSFIYAADFKQFEFRTFLQLIDYQEKEIYQQSIYEFLGKRFSIPAEEAKIYSITKMYSSQPSEFDEILDKKNILNKIKNRYFTWQEYVVFVGDDLKHKMLHSIVQSISQFIYIKKLKKIIELLNEKKSKFIFPLHDSMIFSIDKDEIDLIEKINNVMEDDVYKTKKYIGNNFRDVEEL
jgi:hypothetical protein